MSMCYVLSLDSLSYFIYKENDVNKALSTHNNPITEVNNVEPRFFEFLFQFVLRPVNSISAYGQQISKLSE